MSKKIVICFDGTWNTPDVKPATDGDDSTNVWKLYDAVSPQDASRNKQVRWYDEGVGTHWYDKLLGGAFARSPRERQALDAVGVGVQCGGERALLGGQFVDQEASGLARDPGGQRSRAD